jgi:hypothetical protein
MHASTSRFLYRAVEILQQLAANHDRGKKPWRQKCRHGFHINLSFSFKKLIALQGDLGLSASEY